MEMLFQLFIVWWTPIFSTSWVIHNFCLEKHQHAGHGSMLPNGFWIRELETIVAAYPCYYGLPPTNALGQDTNDLVLPCQHNLPVFSEDQYGRSTFLDVLCK